MSERLETLAMLAAAVPNDLAIVELGVNLGESLLAMAHGAAGGSGATVYGVDLWHWQTFNRKSDRHRLRRQFAGAEVLPAFLERLRDSGLENVVWIQGATHEIAKAWAKPIGLLYIDAAHDENSVREDYEDWSKFVVADGWIAFDDAEPGEKVNRVLERTVWASGAWDNWQRTDVNGRLAYARRS